MKKTLVLYLNSIIIFSLLNEVSSQERFKVKSITPLHIDPILYKVGNIVLMSEESNVYYDSLDLVIEISNSKSELDTFYIRKIGKYWNSDTIILNNKTKKMLDGSLIYNNCFSILEKSETIIKIFYNTKGEKYKTNVIYIDNNEFRYGFSYDIEFDDYYLK